MTFNAVDIVTPTGRCLARRVSFKIEAGRNLLVTGPNTSGKSAIVRVLGELWPVRTGVIGKPGGASSGTEALRHVFLVPQRPYNVLGSLVRLFSARWIYFD